MSYCPGTEHGDTRPPAAWRRKCSSWGQGHCCVGERPNSGRYVLATHGEILLLWDIAGFVLYSCMLTAFLNYSLTKSTFMYMSVIKQYFYYGNNFTWKSIHSLKSFKRKNIYKLILLKKCINILKSKIPIQ